MSLAGPLDLTVAFLLASRRLGLRRAVLGALTLAPVFLWGLPPVSCGYFGPVFGRCTSDAPYFAALKGDLTSLAAQQEIHLADVGTYAHDRESLGFLPAPGARVTVVAMPGGWAAEATHDALGAREGCALYVGAAPVYESGLVERGRPGEVTCTRSTRR